MERSVNLICDSLNYFIEILRVCILVMDKIIIELLNFELVISLLCLSIIYKKMRIKNIFKLFITNLYII